jgi:hypothetical protein
MTKQLKRTSRSFATTNKNTHVPIRAPIFNRKKQKTQQTDKQTNKQIKKKKTNTQTCKQISRHTSIQTNRQTSKQANNQTTLRRTTPKRTDKKNTRKSIKKQTLSQILNINIYVTNTQTNIDQHLLQMSQVLHKRRLNKHNCEKQVKRRVKVADKQLINERQLLVGAVRMTYARQMKGGKGVCTGVRTVGRSGLVPWPCH